uniref:K Homology domain-containing protein n=1 Tax=Kalanchoe fedtschenkoi TaxID=63787 RepID=A0A7N0RH00_KALFE
MIASRSVLRADLVWKITSAHVASYAPRPRDHIQGLRFYQGLSHNMKMGRGKKALHLDITNKQKSTELIWRPVCSQASADVVLAQENANPTDGSKDINMECSSSDCILDVQDTIRESGETVARSESTAEMSVEVGASLMRFIKGKGGMTQKKLEEEMGVKIIFPASKNEESIIIEGTTHESVKGALEKVQVIVDEAINSPNLNYSHFVSLPLAIHPKLVEKLVSFQNSILGTADSKAGDCLENNAAEDNSDDEAGNEQKTADEVKLEDENDCVKENIIDIPLTSYQPKASKSSSESEKLADLGIDKSIFIKPKTFHLTVLMLKLWNKDRINQAANVLKEVSPKVADALDGRPVFIRLKGLETMRGSLAKARVLYAPVEEIGGEGRLVRACRVLIDAYVEAGLVLEKDAKQSLKLHATVMNTSHRRSKMRSRKFDSFDARSILERYGSEDWGEYLISEAHVSQRFVFDGNGYYHCCASIPFPGDPQVK